MKLCMDVSKRYFFNLLLHPPCDIVDCFLIDLILITAHHTALAQSMIRLFSLVESSWIKWAVTCLQLPSNSAILMMFERRKLCLNCCHDECSFYVWGTHQNIIHEFPFLVGITILYAIDLIYFNLRQNNIWRTSIDWKIPVENK